MGVGSEEARGVPGLVLGFEEAVELLVSERDAEVAEELADDAGVLDLLDRPRNPEQRLVVLAEVLGDELDVGQVTVADRLEPRSMPGGDEVGVVRELDERVAPVE